MQRLRAFTLFILAAGASQASLVNGNFDADLVPNGVGTCSGGVGFTGWNSYGFTCGTGLHNPDATQYPGGVAPSGDNVAYHNGPAGFWQSSSLTYQAGQTITFSILVGQRLDEAYTGFQLNLLDASGNIVASTDDTSIPIPTPGTFNPASVSYTVGAGDPLIGQNIGVAFWGRTSGTQTSFDNAELTTSTPEPGSLMLLGSALVGLGFWRRRTRMNQ